MQFRLYFSTGIPQLKKIANRYKKKFSSRMNTPNFTLQSNLSIPSGVTSDLGLSIQG